MHLTLLAAVLLAACLSGLCAENERDIHVFVQTHGSVPPVPQWYSCTHELDDKPYDRRKAEVCLDSIRRHSEIAKARFSLKHYKHRDVLMFDVESPSLTVTDVDWGLSLSDLARFYDLEYVNGDTLRSGAVYDEVKEVSSWTILDMLLRSQGRRAGVSETTYLDYKKNTARVVFKIWDGPLGTPEPLLPPYVQPCKIMNANFNSTDADDFTPVDFVERQLKTQWCGCFSESDVRDDRSKLKAMAFLKEGNMSVTGSGEQRNIDFHFRSNPIPVGQVIVRGYGLLDRLSEREIPTLTIRAGDTYTQSAANAQAEALEKWFSKPGRQVEVFVEVEVSPAQGATLEFGILAYPNDVVYINDNPIGAASAPVL